MSLVPQLADTSNSNKDIQSSNLTSTLTINLSPKKKKKIS